MKELITALLITLASVVLLTSRVWADQSDSCKIDEKEYFIIETRHRLYPEFSQIDTVALEEPFYIGEDEYESKVIAFNPHLGITKEGKALQMSDTLYNPAVRIRVTIEDEVSQENWAFFVMTSPHFRREALLAFRLVDFKVSDKYVKAPAGK